MSIVLVGLDYQSAPVKVRERLYLTGDGLRYALTTLHQTMQAEIVMVSTCNRLEIYASGEDGARLGEIGMDYLVRRAGMGDDPRPLSLRERGEKASHVDGVVAFQNVTQELQAHPQTMVGREAVCHLMRVTAGLESLVIGETEILRQIGDALRQAQEAGTTGAALSRLFHDAMHAGKRARTESAISRHTLSVSHAAVMLAQREFPEMRGVSALVVGAGRMAELAIRALKAHSAGCVRVTNRTDSRASALASRAGIEAVEWKHLNAALRQADVVVTATSAPQPILSAETLARRGRRGLIVIDIGVPRNVEGSAGKLPGVRLYDIDDLQQVVADHRARRQEEAARVETIIAQEAQRYLDWLKSRSAVPTIVALRQKADSVAALEVERALNRLPDLGEREREVVTQMAQRIVNKLLHAPTAALREQSAPADGDLVRQLFDLEVER